MLFVVSYHEVTVVLYVIENCYVSIIVDFRYMACTCTVGIPSMHFSIISANKSSEMSSSLLMVLEIDVPSSSVIHCSFW